MRIERPSDWDSVEASKGGRNWNLPAGNYIVEIKEAKQTLSYSGSEQIEIVCDIAEGEYEGFFASKKYQFDNTYKQPTGCGKNPMEGDKGKFKRFIMDLEASNPGWEWLWDTDSLEGCRLGGRFGEVESLSKDGSRIYTNTRLRFVCAVDAIEGMPVLEKKKHGNGGFGNNEGFGIPSSVGDDDDIPF